MPTDSQPQTTDSKVDISTLDQRLCRSCGYDLMGIDWQGAVCPECGRAFDPNDPTTTHHPGQQSPIRQAVNRYGLTFTLFILFAMALHTSVIPRPITLHEWRLWLWLGRVYGVQQLPQRSYQPALPRWAGPPSRGRVYWWGDRPWRIESQDQAGNTRWDIARRSEGDWVLSVPDPTTQYAQLLGALAAIKPEMFGVQYQNPARGTVEHPLQMTGSTAILFGKLVHESGVELVPFLFRPDQTYVWVFDNAANRLVTLDLDEATERGIEIRAAVPRQQFIDRPIVPKPQPSSGM